MQGAWESFRMSVGSSVPVRYCMCGLIPSWDQFHDPVSMVTKPIQMGPVWLEASVISGIKLADKIWFLDPPASSYLTCMAVKAASFQSTEAEEKLLQLLSTAMMKYGINTDKELAIKRIAEQLSQEINFDLDKFIQDLQSDECIKQFRKDLDEVAVYNIQRFPSIMVRWNNGKSSLISGYRKKEELLKVIAEMETA
jgi:putative protein-disulfide isomerase